MVHEQVLSKANARLSSRCILKEPSSDDLTLKQSSIGTLSLNQASLESFCGRQSRTSSQTGSRATLVEEQNSQGSSLANEKEPKKSVLLTDTKSMESGTKYFSRSPSSVVNETFESRNPSSVINDSFESRNPSSVVNYFVNEQLVGKGSSVNYVVQKSVDSSGQHQLPPLALLDDLENWDAWSFFGSNFPRPKIKKSEVVENSFLCSGYCWVELGSGSTKLGEPRFAESLGWSKGQISTSQAPRLTI